MAIGILKNGLVKLRELKFSDAEFIAENAKDKDIIKYTFVIAPPFDLETAKKFIRKANKEIKDKTAYEFGIELDNTKELIGTINLFNISRKNKNAEIGFWLAKKYWNKGLSDQALSLMLKFGFNELNLKRIQARVLGKNEPAQKLLERTGFELEGKLRQKTFLNNQWFDDLIYGLLTSEYIVK
jgi:[ribosomal protein S5]-alanine N-acetyltransferase